MGLVYAPKEVVQVPHDVLIGTRQKEAKVIRLTVAEGMEQERLAHIAEIREFTHLAIRIAGDVHQRSFARGALVETMQRHDREELA